MTDVLLFIIIVGVIESQMRYKVKRPACGKAGRLDRRYLGQEIRQHPTFAATECVGVFCISARPENQGPLVRVRRYDHAIHSAHAAASLRRGPIL